LPISRARHCCPPGAVGRGERLDCNADRLPMNCLGCFQDARAQNSGRLHANAERADTGASEIRIQRANGMIRDDSGDRQGNAATGFRTPRLKLNDAEGVGEVGKRRRLPLQMRGRSGRSFRPEVIRIRRSNSAAAVHLRSHFGSGSSTEKRLKVFFDRYTPIVMKIGLGKSSSTGRRREEACVDAARQVPSRLKPRA